MLPLEPIGEPLATFIFLSVAEELFQLPLPLVYMYILLLLLVVVVVVVAVVVSVFFTAVPYILILSKYFIYQLMHNRVALKEY